MTILEYAEKIDYLQYLSNDMFGILKEWQKAYEDGIDLHIVYGFRAGRILLSTLIQKYTNYMEGYKDGVASVKDLGKLYSEIRAEAIDEFVNACDTRAKYDMKKHPQNAYCIDRVALLKIAEWLKEKRNE